MDGYFEPVLSFHVNAAVQQQQQQQTSLYITDCMKWGGGQLFEQSLVFISLPAAPVQRLNWHRPEERLQRGGGGDMQGEEEGQNVIKNPPLAAGTVFYTLDINNRFRVSDMKLAEAKPIRASTSHLRLINEGDSSGPVHMIHHKKQLSLQLHTRLRHFLCDCVCRKTLRIKVVLHF